MGRKGRASEIRRFLTSSAFVRPRGLAARAAEHFGISRQTAHHHLQALVKAGVLEASGNTRGREYRLVQLDTMRFKLPIAPGLEEDTVWAQRILSRMKGLPANVIQICYHGFTEMFNNVIDHSEGSEVGVRFTRSAASVELWIADNGVGIFDKIQRALGLADPRHAIIELAKGKLTTDPKNHTGEGVFFTSRIFERFVIQSGSLCFSHTQPDNDWLVDIPGVPAELSGTTVLMVTPVDTKLTTKDVFDRFSDPEHYSFNRTHVPVALAQYGEDILVSRSQAKRLLTRIDRFAEVLLDFTGVASVGQAFADEIFRVFTLQHPEVSISVVNANPEVDRMIRRAKENLAQTQAANGGPQANPPSPQS